jgi:hypothetical protein
MLKTRSVPDATTHLRMDKYTPTSIAAAVASNAQAVGNAMNGQPWLAYIWAGAGCVFVSQLVGNAPPQKLSKTRKRIIVGAIWLAVFASVFAATRYQNIKLEIGKDLATISISGPKFVHIRVRNDGPNPAVCNVYLTDLTYNGQPVENFTNANIVLAARGRTTQNARARTRCAATKSMRYPEASRASKPPD